MVVLMSVYVGDFFLTMHSNSGLFRFTCERGPAGDSFGPRAPLLCTELWAEDPRGALEAQAPPFCLQGQSCFDQVSCETLASLVSLISRMALRLTSFHMRIEGS